MIKVEFLEATLVKGTGYAKGDTLEIDDKLFEKLKGLGLAKKYDAEATDDAEAKTTKKKTTRGVK